MSWYHAPRSGQPKRCVMLWVRTKSLLLRGSRLSRVEHGERPSLSHVSISTLHHELHLSSLSHLYMTSRLTLAVSSKAGSADQLHNAMYLVNSSSLQHIVRPRLRRARIQYLYRVASRQVEGSRVPHRYQKSPTPAEGGKASSRGASWLGLQGWDRLICEFWGARGRFIEDYTKRQDA